MGVGAPGSGCGVGPNMRSVLQEESTCLQCCVPWVPLTTIWNYSLSPSRKKLIIKLFNGMFIVWWILVLSEVPHRNIEYTYSAVADVLWHELKLHYSADCQVLFDPIYSFRSVYTWKSTKERRGDMMEKKRKRRLLYSSNKQAMAQLR